ncbi:hypothetical protein PENTCL1PPCAC_24169, partial [Pristionchus entomophagus]
NASSRGGSRAQEEGARQRHQCRDRPARCCHCCTRKGETRRGRRNKAYAVTTGLAREEQELAGALSAARAAQATATDRAVGLRLRYERAEKRRAETEKRREADAISSRATVSAVTACVILGVLGLIVTGVLLF